MSRPCQEKGKVARISNTEKKVKNRNSGVLDSRGRPLFRSFFVVLRQWGPKFFQRGLGCRDIFLEDGAPCNN